MSNLVTLRDLVERDLDDSGNEIWTTADVDRALERALVEYSQVNPRQEEAIVELQADGREVDISALSGLTRVVRVWYPYDSSAPQGPPQWVRWDKWGETLYVASDQEPTSGDVLRVYYHKVHTVEGLDGASSTTVPQEDEELLVLGAGAYAALQKARSSVGEAGVSEETPEHWMTWGLNRMETFSEGLRRVRTRELRKVDKRVPMDGGWMRRGEQSGI